jgi:hypothetical protein
MSASIFRKSTKCGTNTCVEVAISDDRVDVRDSKQSNGAVLEFTHDEWRDFLAGVVDGEFSLPLTTSA